MVSYGASGAGSGQTRQGSKDRWAGLLDGRAQQRRGPMMPETEGAPVGPMMPEKTSGGGQGGPAERYLCDLREQGSWRRKGSVFKCNLEET